MSKCVVAVASTDDCGLSVNFLDDKVFESVKLAKSAIKSDFNNSNFSYNEHAEWEDADTFSSEGGEGSISYKIKRL